MTRSILWTSSNAPSSLFPSACAALPQPRSRIAFAAETRAACVASFERITPTSALIAVLVWLRAMERISVRVLGMSLRGGIVLGRRMFARRRVRMIHHEIVGLDRRTKRNCWKIRRLACSIGPRNKANDVCAHDNPSVITIATSPINASDSR
jgi:hypothetical protein